MLQRSIRHNLSLKAMFIRMERPVSHPGKGSYWKLNIRMGEGNKRDRKHKDPKADPKADHSLKEDEDEFELSDASSESLAAANMALRGPMSFGPGFMPQANPMFAQTAAGVYGMGSGMPSPPQDPACATGPLPFSGHTSWEMTQDPTRETGPVAYPGMDGSAHRRRGMPVRQHHAHRPYPPISVGNQMQDVRMPEAPSPMRTRRYHSPDDDAEEVRRRARLDV